MCAGGWAESGQRARAWEEKGKTLGNPPQRGSAARWGQPGLPGPAATSQAWRAPPGWDARAAETWDSIGSLQACQRPRSRSEPATKNRVPRAWVGRKELDHGIVRGSVPCRRIHSLEANATKKTHEDQGGHHNQRGREFGSSRIQTSNGGRVQQRTHHRSLRSERGCFRVCFRACSKSPFGGPCYTISCSTSSVPGLLEAVNQHNIPG